MPVAPVSRRRAAALPALRAAALGAVPRAPARTAAALALATAVALPLALAPAGPAAAQTDRRASFLDLLSPDRLVQQVMQYGIMALRTQADIVYQNMSVNVLAGRVALNGLEIRPLPPWDEDGACVITIDRLTLRSAPLDSPDTIRLRLAADGVAAPDICLPEDQRGMLPAFGLPRIELPRVTFDVEYDVPSGGAFVHAFAGLKDVATLSLTGDFEYIWLDGREDMDEPRPIVYVNYLGATVENLGGWGTVSRMLPPEFTGDGAVLTVQGMLGSMLASANREAYEGQSGASDPSRLSHDQRAFVDSAATAWAAFLANPVQLTVETGPGVNNTFLDLESLDGDPHHVFETLQPLVAVTGDIARAALPAALLRKALAPETAASLTDAERRQVGEALLTGFGAPRSLEAGLQILQPLAQNGDAGAALLMAEALEDRAPEDAYRWALRAARAGETEALTLLDKLEAGIGLVRVLELQAEVTGAVSHPRGALASLAGIREQAAMRLAGKGALRNYPVAAMWAMIGRAAGDPEAIDILIEIDDMVEASGAQEAWAGYEADASRLAMQAWVELDLPARFGGR